MPGFEKVRRLFDGIGSKPARAILLTAGAVAPYLMESLRTRTFGFTSFLVLLLMAAAAAFWYVIFDPGPLADLGFLILMAAVFLSKAFAYIYIRPAPHLQLEILGKLMWIRLGIMAVLSLRRIENVRFGFLPSSQEWRIGIEQFLYFIPFGAAAAYFLRFAAFHPLSLVWWKFALFVPATFCGIFWVVALSEEFFFRGFLQQLVSRGLHSNTAGLIVASALFGSAHLLYRGFPNWRFAILAAIAGVFYGISFLRSRSVRASMVTHALVVTTWRSLFAP
jgi:membrane protease YdiL (CAAX protease family)